MSSHIVKFNRAPLVLAAAALVAHIGTATAGDVQQQVRELLTGSPPIHFVPPSGPRANGVTTRALDSQQFAKRLLLGVASQNVSGAEVIEHSEIAGASAKTESQKHPVASVDMQAAVRLLLLGQTHASDAS